MPSAREVLLRDSIIAELNDDSRDWAETLRNEGNCRAIADWWPVFEQPPKDLNLSVVALEIEDVQDQNKGTKQYKYAINITLQKAVDPKDTVMIDGLCYLCQQIQDFYAREQGKKYQITGADLVGKHLVEIALRPDVFDVDSMEVRTFLSVIGLSVARNAG